MPPQKINVADRTLTSISPGVIVILYLATDSKAVLCNQMLHFILLCINYV
jgi:hypothetical protein